MIKLSSKLLSILYGIYHVLFGLDFGFVKFKSSKLNYIMNAWLFVQSLLLSLYSSGIVDDNISLSWFIMYGIYSVHYNVFVTLLSFFKQDISFCDILSNLRIVNSSYHKIEIKMLATIILLTIYRIFDSVIFCLYSNNFTCDINFLRTMPFVALLMCLDLVWITCTFAFYSVLCQLKKFVAILKQDNSDFHSKQILYKSIVDEIEKCKDAFGLLYVTDMVFTVIETMGSMYLAVFRILNKNFSETITVEFSINFINVVIDIFLTFTPALLAGHLATQAEKISVLLHNKLLEQRDSAEAPEIERFITYVEARPCRFRMFKVIPLDADLMGQALNFCVKYLIVIIQFTDKKKN